MEKKETKKKTPAKKAPAKKAVAKKAAPKVTTKGLSASVVDVKGKEVSKVSLPESVFGVSWNPDLVHQVATGMQANARAGKAPAHAKDRSEVRGGGAKPWRQKGTGRARHGSSRSPIWAGGGVTHGPRKDKDYSVAIPKKMRSKALFSALSHKLKDEEVLFVDALPMKEPKTKEAKEALVGLSKVKGFEKLSSKKQNTALIVLDANNDAVKRSFQNFGNVEVEEVRNVNVVDVLSYSFVIFVNPEVSVKTLEGKLTTK